MNMISISVILLIKKSKPLWLTTDNSYWNACGKTCALFREHTYNFLLISGCYISSGFLNGKEMNVNALNTSSGS